MDAFLKAQTIEGGSESIVTEYMLKILGLDVSLLLTFFVCDSPLICPHKPR